MARAVRPNTKLFFAETIGNPKINVLDISLVADVAHEAGVPLIVDNTIATPYLIRPFEHGADIIVHSATKFLGGHGAVIGGVIVDGGKFDFEERRAVPRPHHPDPSYHGLVYARDLGAVGDGQLAYIIKARVQLLRDLGSAIAPASAWQLIQGIETLSLRVERHVAERPGSPSGSRPPRHRLGQLRGPAVEPLVRAPPQVRPQGRRRRAVVRAQGRRRGRPGASSTTSSCQPPGQHRRRALAGHPPGLDHARQLTPEQQLTAGVTPGLVRLSVGIENIDDIMADLDAGFRAAKSV